MNESHVHYHTHHHYSQGQKVEARCEVMRRLEALDSHLDLVKETIMAAIDDLKTAIGALITEATTDVSGLISKINTTTGNDPAVVALTAQVQQAITDLHTTFTNATGVPLPPPAPAPTPPATPAA